MPQATGTLYGMVTVKSSDSYTLVALDTFGKHTRLGENDSFILIDNDGYWTTQHSQEYSNVACLVNSAPKSFSENVNQLIELADAAQRDLVFLSNDVVFTPNWSQRLLSDPNCISLPSCNQTHNRGFPPTLSLDTFGNQFGKLNTQAHLHSVEFPSTYERLLMPFYVFKLPRNVYQRIGLWDTGFVMGAEDVDYRLRALQQGVNVQYCSSFLLHFQGTSTWNGAETVYETQTRNQAYTSQFQQKWGQQLTDVCIGGNLESMPTQLVRLTETHQWNQLLFQLMKLSSKDT